MSDVDNDFAVLMMQLRHVNLSLAAPAGPARLAARQRLLGLRERLRRFRRQHGSALSAEQCGEFARVAMRIEGLCADLNCDGYRGGMDRV
jgi:hypothetical protein